MTFFERKKFQICVKGLKTKCFDLVNSRMFMKRVFPFFNKVWSKTPQPNAHYCALLV